MDFNLKQWRDKSEEEEEQETSSAAKLPRLNPSPALPLFVPQPTTTHLHYSSSEHSTTPSSATRMGSYFSLGQWQELELQALIFRHIISGAAVPPELLHLVKKSLISSPPAYYFCNPLHYHPSSMDPEPGRCRRTDGKKWRCSRDVESGQKYCERHMHRGRNRSRKPVEIPTSANAGGGGGEPNISTPRFSLTSMDNHNPRPMESMTETKCPFDVQNDGQTGADRTLRHFFDDWPRSLHEADNAPHSATNLSISTSDFSLKLGTSNGDVATDHRPHLNWGMTWETGRPAPMGGPLAEALRSSASTSSPTSVLHRLQRTSCSASQSQTSYVTS